MKYRIVQLKNGCYVVQDKKRLFGNWHDIYSYLSLVDAEKHMNECIKNRKENAHRKRGMKIEWVIKKEE